MAEIEYRFLKEASPEELRALEALYREVGWISADDSGAFIARAVSGSALFLAAYADGGLIGMARSLSDLVSDAYIQDVAVVSRFRKRGIGGELVRRLKAELRSRGVDWIGLVGAPGTESFYRELGMNSPDGFTFWQFEER